MFWFKNGLFKADSGTISGLPSLAFFQLYGARHDHLSVSYRWNYANLKHFASKRKPTKSSHTLISWQVSHKSWKLCLNAVMQNDLRRCTSVLIDWWMYVMLSGSTDWLFLSHFHFIQKEARLSKFIYEGNNGHFNLAELVILVIGGKLFL